MILCNHSFTSWNCSCQRISINIICSLLYYILCWNFCIFVPAWQLCKKSRVDHLIINYNAKNYRGELLGKFVITLGRAGAGNIFCCAQCTQRLQFFCVQTHFLCVKNKIGDIVKTSIQITRFWKRWTQTCLPRVRPAYFKDYWLFSSLPFFKLTSKQPERFQ